MSNVQYVDDGFGNLIPLRVNQLISALNFYHFGME